MGSALDKTPAAWEDATAVLDECMTLVTRIHDPTKALPMMPVIGPGAIAPAARGVVGACGRAG